MACVLWRSRRTRLQGNILACREDDHRHPDRHGGRTCFEHGICNRAVRLSTPRPCWPRRRTVRRHPPALNFLDGFYKLAKLNWHAAYQIVMSLCYVTLSVRLIQLILAFRGE